MDALVAPSPSLNVSRHRRPYRTIKGVPEEEQDSALSVMIRQTLHLQPNPLKPVVGNGVSSPQLRRLLARYHLNWTVLSFLDDESQMRLMDHMYPLFRHSRDRSLNYFFYSFWLLSLHHHIGYVVCPKLRGVTLRSPLPVHGGGFSNIFDGLYQGIRVAIKVPRSTASPSEKHQLRKAFLRELACTLYVRHPNIITPYGVNHDLFPEEENQVFIVYPFMKNGTIDLYVLKHPRINRMLLLYEAANALSFLHHDTIPALIHGDIKPGNILISDSGRAILTDIGLGSFLDLPQHDSSRNSGLSWRYAAPELLPKQEPDSDSESEEKPMNMRKNRQTDVYAFAITTYEIIAGRPAFGTLHPMKILHRVSRGSRPARPSTPLMTDELWALLKQAWNQDPNNRPPMKEIADKMGEMAKLPLYQPKRLLRAVSPA